MLGDLAAGKNVSRREAAPAGASAGLEDARAVAGFLQAMGGGKAGCEVTE